MTYSYEKYQYYSHTEIKIKLNDRDMMVINSPIIPNIDIKRKLGNRYSTSPAKIEIVHIDDSKIKVKINW